MAKPQLQLAQYNEVRDRMKAGDIIAFSGRGFPSDQIKLVTHSPISHVGIILQSKLLINGRPQAGMLNQIIESTSLNGFSGVTISRLSDRLANYNGQVWWLPLEAARRKKADWAKFYDFLLRQDHKKYAYEPVARFLLSRLPKIGKYFVSHADYKRFFCSELAVAGLAAAGYLPPTDAANVDPADLCSMQIYRKQYVQIKGDQPLEIPGYNSVPIAGEPTEADEEAAERDEDAPVAA